MSCKADKDNPEWALLVQMKTPCASCMGSQQGQGTGTSDTVCWVYACISKEIARAHLQARVQVRVDAQDQH
jgi:hypothetical protein